MISLCCPLGVRRRAGPGPVLSLSSYINLSCGQGTRNFLARPFARFLVVFRTGRGAKAAILRLYPTVFLRVSLIFALRKRPLALRRRGRATLGGLAPPPLRLCAETGILAKRGKGSDEDADRRSHARMAASFASAGGRRKTAPRRKPRPEPLPKAAALDSARRFAAKFSKRLSRLKGIFSAIGRGLRRLRPVLPRGPRSRRARPRLRALREISSWRALSCCP